MSQSNPEPPQNSFVISNSSITNMAGSGDIHYRETYQESINLKPNRKTILFLAANPLSTDRLRLDQELREVEAGLQRSRHRDRFQLQQQWAVRPRDLQRAMLDYRPQLVHFSGHGVSRPAGSKSAQSRSTQSARDVSTASDRQDLESGLILEDTAGRPKWVSAESLAALFELFADSVECVVLNACYSAHQAAAIAQHVPFVIGMTQAISDRAAIEFAVGFYDAIGAGEPVEGAYRNGIVSMRLAGAAGHLTPTLVKRHD